METSVDGSASTPELEHGLRHRGGCECGSHRVRNCHIPPGCGGALDSRTRVRSGERDPKPDPSSLGCECGACAVGDGIVTAAAVGVEIPMAARALPERARC